MTMSESNSIPAENGLTQKFREMIRGKTRIALAWLFAVALVFSAREYPKWHGTLLCLVGAVIRFWASGYLRKDSRPAIGGPYAWVRNPLYFGTYLMALGTALATDSFILTAVMSISFAIIYHFIILDEEIKLRQIFGAPYLTYCSLVPRFFPRLWPASKNKLLEVNPEIEHLKYDWAISNKNRAHEAFASFVGLIGFVALVAYVWKNYIHSLT